MLKDGIFKHVFIKCGRTDLRSGIEGLIRLITQEFKMDPCMDGALYLFCGTRSDRIKGIYFEGDGFLLVYKRFTDGRLQWPRTPEEVRELTKKEYDLLMEGLTIIPTVHEFTPKRF